MSEPRSPGGRSWQTSSDDALRRRVQNILRAKAERPAPLPKSDQEAILEFYVRHQPLIRRLARRFRVRPSNLEDCVQVAWMRLLQSLKRFSPDDPRADFHTWLYAVVKRVVADCHRRQGRKKRGSPEQLGETDVAGSTLSPEAQLARRERIQRVQKLRKVFKASINRENYLIFLLHWFRGYDAAAIADRLHRSPHSVHSRLYRLQKQFRELLEGEGGADYWLGDP